MEQDSEVDDGDGVHYSLNDIQIDHYLWWKNSAWKMDGGQQQQWRQQLLPHKQNGPNVVGATTYRSA